MKKDNKIVGKIGESEAERWLRDKGYAILERNFGSRFGEIDLICLTGDITVFVEVKTKKGLDFGRPEEMFTRSKLTKIKRMATVYLGGKEVPCRIDMIAVVLDADNQVSEIRHYEGVEI